MKASHTFAFLQILSLVFFPNGSICQDIPEEEASRIDCYPEDLWGNEDVTQAMCEDRGCTFDVTQYPEVPKCYASTDSAMGAGYQVTNERPVPGGYELDLMPRAANGTYLFASHPNRQQFENAVILVEHHGPDIMRIKISHSDVPRYEVPERILNMEVPPDAGGERQYSVVWQDESFFTFQIIRTATGEVLWDTSVGGLVISDQFLSISTKLPSENIYGFGENSHKRYRHDLMFRTWGMFSRDQWVGVGNHNHYSVHPFYTCLENDGNSHGVMLLNSNAMDVTLSPLPMLTYRTVGGVLDFYFFVGPTPENVVQQYTSAIGRPFMPPYWSLGFQLCRYGYNTLENLQAAVNRTHAANIPLDVQYADIDHYDERKVFTIDDENFAGLPEYFDELRAGGMRTVIILDPCLIINETDYEPFDRGLEEDAYIHWESRESMPDEDFLETNTTSMLGFVWPIGKVVFPDFFLNRTEDIWADLIVKHYDSIKFDGLWIDMNEPANFGTNDERPWNWPEDYLPYWSLKCPISALDDPPYRTMATYVYDADMEGERGSPARISDKTLCMTAKQGDGMYDHYDVHSLYGTSQIASTLRGLRTVTGERGLVFGRSTYPGSGHTSGHWLGDNFSFWDHLKDSIVGMLEFNLFGFPYIGADICGFFEETTAELCMRWQQLGAFYPYSRNHNQADNLVDQDPGNFNELVSRLSRESMEIRYQLLPYLYTLFFEAHTEGNTVVRALFHEFPTDNNTWAIDEQFLWGEALLISPILSEGQTEISYYLPEGVWYDFYTGTLDHFGDDGAWYQEPVQEDSPIPLHIRGGHVFPTQEHANNTYYSRQNPFHLWVYLDRYSQAEGELFWDDGVSLDAYENGEYYMANYSCSLDGCIMRVTHTYVGEMTDRYLDSVEMYGVHNTPTEVLLNGQPHMDYGYDPATEILSVFFMNWPMEDDLVMDVEYD